VIILVIFHCGLLLHITMSSNAKKSQCPSGSDSVDSHGGRLYGKRSHMLATTTHSSSLGDPQAMPVIMGGCATQEHELDLPGTSLKKCLSTSNLIASVPEINAVGASNQHPGGLKRRNNSNINLISTMATPPRKVRKTKIGSHSVHSVGVIDTLVNDIQDLSGITSGRDLLSVYLPKLLVMPQGCGFDLPQNEFKWATNIRRISTPNFPAVAQTINYRSNRVKQRFLDCEYTRVVWGPGVKVATIDLSPLKTTGSSNITSKRVVEMIGSVLPWIGRFAEAIGPFTNSGTTVYNNSSLYMKGLSLALCVERITLGQIPIPMPDLHDAPLQFVLVDNQNDYAAAYRVISQAMTEESFILIEGYDYQPEYIVELAYLSLGGCPFAPQFEDASIAFQSYRWPRIPILVICRGEVPNLPQIAPLNTRNMVALLKKMSQFRKEERDYTRRLHHVTMVTMTFPGVLHFSGQHARQQEVPTRITPDMAPHFSRS